MTESIQRGSATIYEFPVRGRFASGDQDNAKANVAALRTAQVVSGGSWYHEEAIQDAERARTN